MRITRQPTVNKEKLWTEDNVPKTLFVLTTLSGSSSAGTDSEYLVIPQTGAGRERIYHLVNLYTATKIVCDPPTLASQMNVRGATSSEVEISASTHLQTKRKEYTPESLKKWAQSTSIGLIRTNVEGYCLFTRRDGNPNIKETLYDVTPLDGGTSWMTSIPTLSIGVRNGTHEIIEEANLTITNVDMLPEEEL